MRAADFPGPPSVECAISFTLWEPCQPQGAGPQSQGTG